MRSEVILLAGGLSSRSGDIPKGLIPVAGKPWIRWQLDNLLELGFSRVHVVLGFHAEKYRSHIPEKCEVHINPVPEWGPFSSLRTALVEVKGDTFLLPLDTPCPSSAVWETLEEGLRDHWVAIPRFETQGGHPVLLSQIFQKLLKTIELDSPMARLDYQIWQLPENKVVRIAVSESVVVQNLNTSTDFAEMHPESIRHQAHQN